MQKAFIKLFPMVLSFFNAIKSVKSYMVICGDIGQSLMKNIEQTSARWLADGYLRPTTWVKPLRRLSTAFIQLLTILAAMIFLTSPVSG